jgi:parallel beta-helix repeat protein
MKKKVNAFVLSLILVINFAIIFEIAPAVSGTTIFVDDDYTVEDGTHKMTIQAAVDAANPGDEVFVYSGYYPENVWIDKTINLTGEDRNNTIIDGGMNADSVTIFASWVNVSGFRITGGDPSGVYITSFSVYNTIENNTIIANQFSGVEIYWYSDYNTLANNTIINNPGSGVLMEFNNQYNRIVDNYFDNNGFSGVLIDNPSSADPNFNNYVAYNVINNSQYGVYLYDSNDDNNIEGNFINNTDYGIILSISNENNIITKNTVLNSVFFNIYFWASSNNKIYHNNFLNEINLAYDTGVNQWNLSYPNGGNFWGNYSGGDNKSGPSQDIPGNDAFGDVPIIIAGGPNIDNYPLWPNWDALQYYKPAPGPKNVCEYAMGSVKVAVFFVESNGSIDPESENWSDSRKSQVLSEIQEAFSFWEGLEADADLTFSIEDMGRRNTSYEAITRPSSDVDLWIGEIMDNLGIESGFYLLRVMSFNHWLREQYDTDWAFSIFVADSYNDTDGSFADPPRSAWANWMAGNIVMTYDNSGYGIDFMNNVAAHETGHMFYATDEYANPGERSGYLNELEVDDSGALMDVNNLWLSSGTELQIGWRDSDSDSTMDILDTEPNTYLEPYEPDPTFNASPTYSGYAVVVPYPNENPNGYSLDVTLNKIAGVQFRIDNGSWMNATSSDGAFDEEIEAFSFTTPLLSAGTHFIETRSINSVNNSDPTYANDTITILGDSTPPEILETTSDVPRTGDFYNVTADIVDNLEVDTVWLECTITSSDGYYQTYNISMNNSGGNSYWVQPNIWSNASWFNYSISANDTDNNWNSTSEKSLNFRVHNLDSGFGFTVIQYAIDDVDTLDRHTIFVDEGIYYENVVVDKSINLTGDGMDNTIIDGVSSGDAVNVTANWVNITSFTITGSGVGYEKAGLMLYYVQNCTIIYNNISMNKWSGISGISSSNNTLTNNIIFENIFGIKLHLSFYNKILNNTIISNLDDAIYFSSLSNNNTIMGNDILNNGDGLRFISSSNNSILWNNVSNSGFAIMIYLESNNTVIENNNVMNNTQGIRILSSSYCNIVSNNVFLSDSNGISIWTSSNNTIANNTIISNAHDGVQFDSFSNNNNVTQNNISFNNQGIMIGASYMNNITENYVMRNFYGIGVYSSFNNKIYHNHIINNTNQANDDSANGNQWDNGYPSGGNYWSDYSGEDLYSGPNQDIVGDDGIGDTNYTIDSDSVDHYPLLLGVGDNIFLYEGWNLISIPAIQSITDIDSVLAQISGSYDAVQYYDNTDSSHHWKHNHILKPSEMNDLNSINHTMGFFIHITDTPGVVFEYGGLKLTVNQTITLHKGWNMVGFPSLGNYNRSVGLNNLEFGVDVDAIQWFDAATKTWNFLEEGDLFVPGRGYWIHSKVETTWDVPL